MPLFDIFKKPAPAPVPRLDPVPRADESTSLSPKYRSMYHYGNVPLDWTEREQEYMNAYLRNPEEFKNIALDLKYNRGYIEAVENGYRSNFIPERTLAKSVARYITRYSKEKKQALRNLRKKEEYIKRIIKEKKWNEYRFKDPIYARFAALYGYDSLEEAEDDIERQMISYEKLRKQKRELPPLRIEEFVVSPYYKSPDAKLTELVKRHGLPNNIFSRVAVKHGYEDRNDAVQNLQSQYKLWRSNKGSNRETRKENIPIEEFARMNAFHPNIYTRRSKAASDPGTPKTPNNTRKNKPLTNDNLRRASKLTITPGTYYLDSVRSAHKDGTIFFKTGNSIKNKEIANKIFELTNSTPDLYTTNSSGTRKFKDDNKTQPQKSIVMDWRSLLPPNNDPSQPRSRASTQTSDPETPKTTINTPKNNKSPVNINTRKNKAPSNDDLRRESKLPILPGGPLLSEVDSVTPDGWVNIKRKPTIFNKELAKKILSLTNSTPHLWTMDSYGKRTFIDYSYYMYT